MQSPSLGHWLHDHWARAIICVCALFHLTLSGVVLVAPAEVVVTEGTLPVFDLMGRVPWSLVFLLAGVTSLALAVKPTRAREVVTWGVIIPAGFAWTGSIGVAVIQGRSSAVLLVVWPTLMIVFAIAGVWIAIRDALLQPHDEG